ncbi:hypothetical protein VUR80DRAFT_206 [Thermomyces stellatus]
MSTAFTVIAFLYPRPEKLDRAIEVAEELISYVKDNEPGTLTYEWYKTVDEAGAVRLTVFEKYSSKEAFDAHAGSSVFAETFRKMKEEDLLASESKIETPEQVGGFRR